MSAAALEDRTGSSILPIGGVRKDGLKRLYLARNEYVYPVRELDDIRNLRTYVIDNWDTKSRENAITFDRIGTGYKVYVSAIDVTRFLKPGDGSKPFRYTGPRHFGFEEGNQYGYSVSFMMRNGIYSDVSIAHTLHNCELYMTPMSGKALHEARERARKENKRIDEILVYPELPDEVEEEFFDFERTVFGEKTDNLQGVITRLTRFSQGVLRNCFGQRKIPALNVKYDQGKPVYTMDWTNSLGVPWTRPVRELESAAAQWQMKELLDGTQHYIQQHEFGPIQLDARARAEKKDRKYARQRSIALVN